MNPIIDPMPLSARTLDLLQATERDLGDGIAPLGHQFLCDHEVTLDEAYTLADTIGLALKVFRTAPAMQVAMAIGMEAAAAGAPA